MGGHLRNGYENVPSMDSRCLWSICSWLTDAGGLLVGWVVRRARGLGTGCDLGVEGRDFWGGLVDGVMLYGGGSCEHWDDHVVNMNPWVNKMRTCLRLLWKACKTVTIDCIVPQNHDSNPVCREYGTALIDSLYGSQVKLHCCAVALSCVGIERRGCCCQSNVSCDTASQAHQAKSVIA